MGGWVVWQYGLKAEILKLSNFGRKGTAASAA